ncbi:acyltransferase [Stieleria sp. JC731]|uniref:acyltransferase family protein n=1 Tax=Pirellulaceae TaxID=2691357 RepID=UPI001E3139D7|nr:acyltransferase family protein [Stieleria sp. JC731]MCC9601774.1 acyltransferase [Stieleria sp. JC731]
MIEFKYRPDVDGLRAVAVVLVLLFHAGLGFKGGFIGVDVFFVISGFLITGLILKEQNNGDFSLGRFWVRRIRRILPAATAMVVLVLIAGFFVMVPLDYTDLGKSTIAQQLMLSNVFFWRNTGYFDGPSDLKPLLHTWSLAVEEQFYLGYPLLLIWLARFKRQVSVAVLSTLFLGSLVLSEYGVHKFPSGAFFLLPTRAWEMLAGALICFLPKPNRVPDIAVSAVSGAALSMIVLTGWHYDATTPFPGLSAMLPCLCTAALIYINSAKLSRPAKLLATKPVVFVGLISYSLYLWHWPILAFVRYTNNETLTPTMGIVAIVASFSAGYLSWRYIETPFRKKQLLVRLPRLFAATAISVSVCLLAGGTIYLSQGFPQLRYGDQYTQLIKSMDEKAFRHHLSVDDIEQQRLPKFGDQSVAPSVLVWGDSHAMAVMPAIDQVCNELGLCGVQSTTGGTLPLVEFDGSNSSPQFADFAERTIEYCKDSEIEVAILAGYWIRDASHPKFESSLRETIDELRDLGIHVILLRDVPDQLCNPRQAINVALKEDDGIEKLGVLLQDHRVYQQKADHVLQRMAADEVTVLDPAPHLVDDSDRCRIVFGDKCMYWDNDHLTVSGALRLTGMFRHAFEDTDDKI